MEIFSVYIGGIEVNDYQLTLNDAKSLANVYLNNGYDDVQIFNLIKNEVLS